MIFVFFRTFYARYRLDQALKIGWSALMALAIVALGVGIGLGAANVVGWL